MTTTRFNRAGAVALVVQTALGAASIAGSARGEPGKARKQTLAIDVASASDDVDACRALADAMTTQLEARRKFAFDAADEEPVHKLTITCLGSAVRAVWTTRLSTRRTERKGRRTVIARAQIRAERVQGLPPASAALVVLRHVMRQLPWDGTLQRAAATSSGASESAAEADEPDTPAAPKAERLQILGTSKRRDFEGFATLATGFVDDVIGVCLPIDVGRLVRSEGAARFVKVGEGLVTAVDAFSAEAEIYVDQAGLDDQSLYFQAQAPNAKGSEVRYFVRKCKERIGEDGPGTLAKLKRGDFLGLLSKETFELNLIRQRLGLSASTLRTSGGANAKYALGGYFHNSLEIGDLIALDMRAYRSVLAAPYAPAPAKVSQPTATYADGFAGLSLDFREYHLILGPGLILDKINAPEFGTSEAGESVLVRERRSRIRPALLLSLHGDWDAYWIGVRGVFGRSKPAGNAATISLDANYRLSDTWFVGLDVAGMQLDGTSDGDAGARMIGIGAHLGLSLRRSKPGR